MTVLADVPGPDMVVTPEMDPATKLVTGCPDGRCDSGDYDSGKVDTVLRWKIRPILWHNCSSPTECSGYCSCGNWDICDHDCIRPISARNSSRTIKASSLKANGNSVPSCGTTVVVPPSGPGTVRVVTGTFVTIIVFVPSVPETVVVPPRLPASKLVKLDGTEVTITVGRSVASCGTTVVVPLDGPGTVRVVNAVLRDGCRSSCRLSWNYSGRDGNIGYDDYVSSARARDRRGTSAASRCIACNSWYGGNYDSRQDTRLLRYGRSGSRTWSWNLKGCNWGVCYDDGICSTAAYCVLVEDVLTPLTVDELVLDDLVVLDVLLEEDCPVVEVLLELVILEVVEVLLGVVALEVED
ncbi:hypothetical protein BJ166DRAFT_500255 [Pestalotiopsis sp. NC0098]|nr:hypothetical protein BJ166DRAFT_500255 [Pestalotiopsis sp. NC0098]